VTPNITELVRNATVVIADGQKSLGSGFFIAPDRVLTCAHVLYGHAAVSVRWNGGAFGAEVLSCVPAAPGADGRFAAPDAAVLAVTGFGVQHPVVPLGLTDPESHDKLYVYGMTAVRTGKAEPDGSPLLYGGRVGDRNELFKLVGGQIAEGLSGGPVLNLRTHEVCGMIKQGRPEERGGYAVPIADALATRPDDDLWAGNQACHDGGMAAWRRAQSGFGDLPARVTWVIEQQHAGRMLEGQLAELGRTRSPLVPDEDRDEWVSRQLFTLSLGELVDLLDASAAALDRVALEILQLVSCCLPVNDEPTSYWVPPEAAAALREEWREKLPKVVRVATECRETAQLMALRAIYRTIKAGRILPFSAETGPDGLPTDLVNDVFSALARYGVNSDSWPARRGEVLAALGGNAPVFCLDGRVLGDVAVLAPLLDRFGGFRFMIISRDVLGDRKSEHLVDLRPPVDAFYEGLALGLLRDIEDKIGVRIVAA
jgi:hypothetical protein